MAAGLIALGILLVGIGLCLFGSSILDGLSGIFSSTSGTEQTRNVQTTTPATGKFGNYSGDFTKTFNVNLQKGQWVDTGIPVIANCTIDTVDGGQYDFNQRQYTWVMADQFDKSPPQGSPANDKRVVNASKGMKLFDNEGVPERFGTTIRMAYFGQGKDAKMKVTVTCYKCPGEESNHVYWHKEMRQWFMARAK